MFFFSFPFFQIVQSDIIITSTDELKVLTAKTSSLQEQNDRLQEEVDTLKSKYTKLESSGDLRDKALRSLIETETGQREDDIAKLKTEIAEKESRMKEVHLQVRCCFNLLVFILPTSSLSIKIYNNFKWPKIGPVVFKKIIILFGATKKLKISNISPIPFTFRK